MERLQYKYNIETDEWITEDELIKMENQSIQDKNVIYELKKEYENIYLTIINGIEFIFRPISLKELRLIQDTYNTTYEMQEKICRECVINPIIEDWSMDLYAGFPEEVSNQIIQTSNLDEVNFRKIQNIYKLEQSKIDNDLFLQIPLIISRRFSFLDLREIENWEIEKQMIWLAKASWLDVYEGGEEIKLEEN